MESDGGTHTVVMSPLGRPYLCLCLRADKLPKIKAKAKAKQRCVFIRLFVWL